MCYLLYGCLFWCHLVVCVFAQLDFQGVFYTDQTAELVQIGNNGREIHITLNERNASGFRSYKSYLFGTFNMQMKLPPNDSAGVVSTFYMSAMGDKHDELDLEFLGNVSGQPYALQTNVYASGVGEREQRINLWFDPTYDFHNYSFLWNPDLIVFSVDDQPIRIFPNLEAKAGVPYLHNQSMLLLASIYNADQWATQGGMIKTNWSHAPFVAAYRDFTFDACNNSECATTKSWSQETYQAFLMNSTKVSNLQHIQETYMFYDYCADSKRSATPPPECIYTMFARNASTAPSPSPSSQTSSSARDKSPLDSSPSSFSPSQSPFSLTFLRTWIFHFLIVATINFYFG